MKKEHRLSDRSRLWIGLGIVGALLVAAAVALVVALPGLVNTPEFRAALAARAGAALGAPVEWKSLEIGFFPPRVILEEPRLVGQDESAATEASIRAQAIDLRLAWLPLLERRVAIESLVLHGVDLVATRTPEGLVLPEVLRAGARTDEAPPEADAADESGVFALDLRELRLEEARVLVHDRTLTPPVDWRLDALSLTARGRSLGDPLDVEASTRVFANERELGGVSATGELGLDGRYDLELGLEGIRVAELQAFVSDLEIAAGELSGPIAVAGQGSLLERVATDLEIAGLRVRARGVDLEGDLGLRAQRKGEEKIGFEATWAAAAGGRADVTGERSPAGDVELTAQLDALELAPFAPLVGPDRQVAGQASGEVSLALVAGSLARVETDLVIESARYADGRLDASGRLDLALGLESLEPDAPIRVQAVFAPANGGRVDVNATGTRAGKLRSALRFDAFDVSLLSPLLPEDTRFAGKLTGDLELETTAEREVVELESKLRVGAARLVRGAVDVAGDLSLDARSEGSGPVALFARATLEDGGRVELEGSSTRKGVLDLQTRFSDFDLAAVTPFLDSPDLGLAGRATGRGALAGPFDALESLGLDLAIAGAALRSGDAELEGPLTLRLELAKPLSAERRGTLDLDLSEARVAKGEAFQKPVGVRLLAKTKLESAESGRIAFESRIALHNINELLVRGSVGPKTALRITSPAFELRGWSDLLPALVDYSPEGAMAFEDFSFERSEGVADRFGGRITLRNVDLTLPGDGKIRVRGSGVGAGERIELAGFSATLHGLTLGVEGRVEDPLVNPRFELAAHSIGEAEANDLVSGLSSVRDTLYGALRFDAHLAGSTGGETPLYETLVGTVRFTVGESGGGRLRGVSLLRTTLAQIPVLGGATRIAARLRETVGATDDLGSNLGERFELLEGDLAIGGGAIDARTLRIRYRGHEARLTGRMALEGLVLDMRGELLLDSTLVAALAGRPANELAGRAPVRIPLARVTNTLADPKVSLAPETLAAAPQLLFLTTGVGQVVDEAIGQVGKTVDRAIGGITGGGRKDREKPATSPTTPTAPTRPETRPSVVAPPSPAPDRPVPSEPAAEVAAPGEPAPPTSEVPIDVPVQAPSDVPVAPGVPDVAPSDDPSVVPVAPAPPVPPVDAAVDGEASVDAVPATPPASEPANGDAAAGGAQTPVESGSP